MPTITSDNTTRDLTVTGTNDEAMQVGRDMVAAVGKTWVDGGTGEGDDAKVRCVGDDGVAVEIRAGGSGYIQVVLKDNE